MPWQYSCGRVYSCRSETGYAYFPFLLKYSVAPYDDALMRNVAFVALARFLDIVNKTSEDMMRRAWA